MKYTNDNQEQLNKLLSVLCMICGVAAIPMVCYWYIGMALAVASVGLGIYVWKKEGRNRLITTGMICAGLYLVFFLILISSIGLYYNMINLNG